MQPAPNKTITIFSGSEPRFVTLAEISIRVSESIGYTTVLCPNCATAAVTITPSDALIFIAGSENSNDFQPLQYLRRRDPLIPILVLDASEQGIPAQILYENRITDYARVVDVATAIEQDLPQRIAAFLKDGNGNQALLPEISDEVVRAARFWNMLQDITSIALLVSNSNHQIVAFNRGAEQLSGYDRSEILGQQTSIFYKQDKEYLELLERLRLNTNVEDYGVTIKHKDGGMVPVALSIERVNDDRGKMVANVGIAVDQRERTAMLDELNQRNSELANFADKLVHELRTPLTLLCSFLDMLEMDWDSATRDELLQYARQAREYCLRTQQIISSLNKFSRQTGTPLCFSSINLNSIIQNVAHILRFDLAKAKTELRVDPELPEAWGDMFALELIFYNLLNNALKFAYQERAPILHISVEPGESVHTITVADNGRGIPPGQEKKIFEIFKRGNAGPEIPGEGIGLTIVELFVRKHRGRIWAERSPELGGAAFRFTLPAHPFKT